jgi:hypothetical protein
VVQISIYAVPGLVRRPCHVHHRLGPPIDYFADGRDSSGLALVWNCDINNINIALASRPSPQLMAIARYSSKRTHDEAVFGRLHALPPCKQGTDIARWAVAVADSEASHDDALPTAKRQRVRSLRTTSQRLNAATHNMAAASPTRRSRRDRFPPRRMWCQHRRWW